MNRLIPSNSFFRRPVGCLVGSVLAVVGCLFAFVAFFVVRDMIVYRDVIRSRMESGARPVARPEQPSDLPTNSQVMTATIKVGDANRGRDLFNTNACHACHSLNAGENKVGPALYGIWQRATTRKPGLSAQEYLRESIVEPNAFVVPNFNAGIMPATFGKQLSEQDIADLIAFMQRDLSQK